MLTTKISLTKYAVVFDSLFPVITSFQPGKKTTEWTNAYDIIKAKHFVLLQDDMIVPQTMDAAAEDGRLDIVTWLNENYPKIGCTTDAMDYAAAEGHLEVVKYLNQYRTEGCTAKAMNFAAAGGFLQVVEYLYHCTSNYDIVQAISHASDFKQFHVVAWLQDQPFRRHPLLDCCSSYSHEDITTPLSKPAACAPTFMEKVSAFFSFTPKLVL